MNPVDTLNRVSTPRQKLSTHSSLSTEIDGHSEANRSQSKSTETLEANRTTVVDGRSAGPDKTDKPDRPTRLSASSKDAIRRLQPPSFDVQKSLLCIVLCSIVPGLLFLSLPMIVLLPVLLLASVPIMGVFQLLLTLNHLQKPQDKTVETALALNYRGKEKKSSKVNERFNCETPKKNPGLEDAPFTRMPLDTQIDGFQSRGSMAINRFSGILPSCAMLKQDQAKSGLTPLFAILAVVFIPILSLLCIPLFLFLPLLLILIVPLLVIISTTFFLTLPILGGFVVFPSVLLLFFFSWNSTWTRVKAFVSSLHCDGIVYSYFPARAYKSTDAAVYRNNEIQLQQKETSEKIPMLNKKSLEGKDTGNEAGVVM